MFKGIVAVFSVKGKESRTVCLEILKMEHQPVQRSWWVDQGEDVDSCGFIARAGETVQLGLLSDSHSLTRVSAAYIKKALWVKNGT